MPTDPTREKEKSRDAVRRAVAYLRSCDIDVPRFGLSTKWERRIGGSFVNFDGTRSRLNMGRYPTGFLRNWFAMHELGHVLWNHHRPHRWKNFREAFGGPAPANYDDLFRVEAWKTPAAYRLSWCSGPHRPAGEPSWYGGRAGGEERFCELIALMYANGDFSKAPPGDLDGLWKICWNHGLARMA